MPTDNNETNTLTEIVQRDDFHDTDGSFEYEVVGTGKLPDLNVDEKVVTLRAIRGDTISIPYDIEKEQLRKENRKANRLEAGGGDRPDTATHK